MRMMRTLTPLIVLGTAALGACAGDNTGPAASQSRMRLSLASRPTGTASANVASLNVTSPTPGTFTDGTNTLVLTRVQLVLRKIELKRADAARSACADLPVSADVSGSGEAEPGDDHGHDGLPDDHGHDGVADSCEEAELGPVLLDVPVTSAGAKQSLSIQLDAGTYVAVEFKVHKPEAPEDQAFLQANPGFAGKSIHVEGTWNGDAVSFDTDLTAEEELALQPPLSLSADGAADVTIMVDVGSWFSDHNGGLVNPATANEGQANEGLVSDNIQHSFHAFEDENEDGRDDHGTD